MSEEPDELLEEEEIEEENDEEQSTNTNKAKKPKKDKDIYSRIFDSIVGEGTNRDVPVEIRVYNWPPEWQHLRSSSSRINITTTNYKPKPKQQQKIRPQLREWSTEERESLK